MPLSSKERRELSARGHHLEAALTIAAAGTPLADSVVEHVRSHLTRHPLIKVRIRTDNRSVCDQAAAELAERVPCEIVRRIGRVALLHRPADGENAA